MIPNSVVGLLVFAGTVSVSQSIEGMESFAFMCHVDFVVRKKETSKTLMD